MFKHLRLLKKKRKKLHTVDVFAYAGLQDGLRGKQEACIPLPSAPSHSGVPNFKILVLEAKSC